MSITVTLNLLGVRPFQLLEETMSFDESEAPTLADLIGRVDQRNPGFSAAMLDDAGRLSRQFAFLINGLNAEYSGGTAAPLAAGDVINVIPAIAGG
ncbi:MoaD/ThiS family protein [Magnetospirillum sp. 15-1]|uniref:MoaD/ThiS family protein n=1 Tax=Magnetospirillum sp. 15-1 TaxID=1979370 RepID=UPI000BBCB714|nr:MoaD/ThiS family protein [Magnetospirillum sp. 15-1]